MIVFTRSETFDFDNLLEDFAKFAMMHKTKILDVGERITDVADIDEDIEKILGLW